jgi:hypothetical protein
MFACRNVTEVVGDVPTFLCAGTNPTDNLAPINRIAKFLGKFLIMIKVSFGTYAIAIAIAMDPNISAFLLEKLSCSVLRTKVEDRTQSK